MKTIINETDGRMWVELQAETLREAALIVRFKNAKKFSIQATPQVHRDGDFFLTISADKKHNSSGEVKA